MQFPESFQEPLQYTYTIEHHDTRTGVSHYTSVGSETGQTSREKKVVVLRELHRAIIYTTEMSKQVTKSHVRGAVHMYNVN